MNSFNKSTRFFNALFITLLAVLALACSDDEEVQPPLSGNAAISTFTIGDFVTTISQTALEVIVRVPTGTPVNALVPTIVIPEGATISPASGVARDFTTPVEYIVTAENGTVAKYTVKVEFMIGITAFRINAGGYIFPAEIDHDNKVISIAASFAILRKEMLLNHNPLLTEATLVSGYSLSPQAGTEIDLDQPAPVQVLTAPNGKKESYDLVIRNADAKIISVFFFALPGVHDGFLTATPANGVDPKFREGLADTDLVAHVLPADNLTQVTTTFEVSERATVSPSPGAPKNFNEDVTLVITAESKYVSNVKVRFVKVPIMFLNGRSISSRIAINADGTDSSIGYRTSKPVTAATLVSKATGAEVSCSVSTSAYAGVDYLKLHPVSAFAPGEYTLRVKFDNGEEVEAMGLFRAD